MKKILFTLAKVVIASIIISLVMMLILAFIMLKMDVSNEVQKTFVILIYIVSTFVSGLIMGKVMENKKFLWGMGCGLLYFAIVLVLALAVKNNGDITGVGTIACLAACMAGGTLGGMAG